MYARPLTVTDLTVVADWLLDLVAAPLDAAAMVEEREDVVTRIDGPL